MANPQTIDLGAAYLDADTLRWPAWGLRHDYGLSPGEGAAGYEDFRVLQRQAGANMSVDVGATAAGLMVAWVRGSTRTGQGLYRGDNVDRTAPTTSTYKAQLNVDVSANASGNPRLDMVVLEVLDAKHTGASSTLQIRVVAGTGSVGATLDNRTGAAALPASSILLADILVTNGAVSIVTADIRDRRAFPLAGVVPPLLTDVDQVAFLPIPGAPVLGNVSVTPAGGAPNDNTQAAVLMFLPRRIVGATRIRWKYTQTGTAAATNYVFSIADASGRVIISTAATAFTGALNTIQVRSETIAATTFEAGWYYVMFGVAVMTAASSVLFTGITTSVTVAGFPTSPYPNAMLRVAGGGSVAPTTLLAFTDISGLTATTAAASVPIVAVSVG